MLQAQRTTALYKWFIRLWPEMAESVRTVEPLNDDEIGLIFTDNTPMIFNQKKNTLIGATHLDNDEKYDLDERVWLEEVRHRLKDKMDDMNMVGRDICSAAGLSYSHLNHMLIGTRTFDLGLVESVKIARTLGFWRDLSSVYGPFEWLHMTRKEIEMIEKQEK